MEILKRGELPGDRKWEGGCTSCLSEATAVRSELKNVVDDQRDGPHAREECPVCKTQNMILYPVSK